MNIQIIAMICITIILVSGLISVSIVLWKSIHMAGDKESAIINKIFGGGKALRLITVSLVVACASYLALSDSLEQSVATLLSGVAGFVLGGIDNNNSSPERSPMKTIPEKNNKADTSKKEPVN